MKIEQKKKKIPWLLPSKKICFNLLHTKIPYLSLNFYPCARAKKEKFKYFYNFFFHSFAFLKMMSTQKLITWKENSLYVWAWSWYHQRKILLFLNNLCREGNLSFNNNNKRTWLMSTDSSSAACLNFKRWEHERVLTLNNLILNKIKNAQSETKVFFTQCDLSSFLLLKKHPPQ